MRRHPYHVKLGHGIVLAEEAIDRPNWSYTSRPHSLSFVSLHHDIRTYSTRWHTENFFLKDSVRQGVDMT